LRGKSGNLESVWTELGRQPVKRDLKKPLSKYSYATYADHFGGFRNALEAFINYIKEEENNVEDIKTPSEERASIKKKPKRRTSRNISDRMRFRILSRDGFTCQSCGASPIKERGVELHVDHIKPWSKGGETVEENLMTKCKNAT
jgi:5-methylcytosine-specific restriction endonuclease McrA